MLRIGIDPWLLWKKRKTGPTSARESVGQLSHRPSEILAGASLFNALQSNALNTYDKSPWDF
jgi:hypothetical protein